MLRNTSLVSRLDGCALTVPCHAPSDAPVGLLIAGPGGADRGILATGVSVEAELARALG